MIDATVEIQEIIDHINNKIDGEYNEKDVKHFFAIQNGPELVKQLLIPMVLCF